jgi:DNA helicase-2/ATP-dependent DNA helicase PcrA
MAVATAKNTGFLHALHEDKTIEGIARYENVQELLNAIKMFTLSPEQIDTRLVTFLQHVALVTDSEVSNQNDGDKVSLMTIHAAKGLEYRYVYIVGLEEDLFPSPLMLGSKEDLEEERRLFYVALTRAKKKVFLSYTLSRFRFGKFKTCEPSRFLLEIAPSCLQTIGGEKNYTDSSRLKYASNFVKNAQYGSRKPLDKSKAPLPSRQSSSITEATIDLFPGMSVQHPMFGKGIVIQIDETLGQKKVNIRFEKQGEKTLLLKFAKLQVMEQYKGISKS